MKKRLILVTAGLLIALTPAAAGAIGNTSLSSRVPVSGPTTTIEPADDRGGLVDRDQRVEPGDDRETAGVRSPAPESSVSQTPEPSSTPAPTSTHDVADDHGGLVDRDLRTEPGDDRDARGASDDRHSGSDDGPGHDAGDDHGGSRHGGDDH